MQTVLTAININRPCCPVALIQQYLCSYIAAVHCLLVFASSLYNPNSICDHCSAYSKAAATKMATPAAPREFSLLLPAGTSVVVGSVPGSLVGLSPPPTAVVIVVVSPGGGADVSAGGADVSPGGGADVTVVLDGREVLRVGTTTDELVSFEVVGLGTGAEGLVSTSLVVVVGSGSGSDDAEDEATEDEAGGGAADDDEDEGVEPPAPSQLRS